MVDQRDIEAVRRWAARNPLVRRVWVFGSRVRDKERVDSDLDVAVEHDAKPGDSDAFTTAICEIDTWKQQLSPQISVVLDLQSYIPGISKTVEAALAESSQLVYERAT